MEQQLGFCTTSDGISIAYATVGDGPPLVYATGWPGHLSSEWEKPHAREFLEELAQGVTLIRYDMRGSGLSDRDPGELSFENWLLDLEAVADHLEVENFPLLSLGALAGPITIAYAAAHQERVTHLILSEGFARGSELTTPERAKTLIDFVSLYGRPNTVGSTDLSTENLQKLQDVTKIGNQAASVEVQGEAARTMFSVDVTSDVEKISMPTLVMHGHDSPIVPFALGRNLAARIPHSKFVPFEKSISTPWLRQEEIITEIRRFLNIEVQPRPRATWPSASDVQEILSTERRDAPIGRERTNVEPEGAGRRLAAIMFTDLVGSTALTARSEAAGLRAKERHRELVAGQVARYGGELLEAPGDETLSLFGSAVDAVNCALTLQAECASLPDVRLHVGIHLGDVLVRGREVHGDGVNIASRICALSEGGGICVSEEVQHSIQNQENIESRSLGQHELKNVPRPVEVFAVGRPGSVMVGRPRRAQARFWSQGRSAVAVLALVVVAVIAWLIWDQTRGAAAGPIRSIAVLPLANLSGDPEQEYFADGMTEALISELAKIKSIRVISRTSVMTYKGTQSPLKEIARKLGVDALVEGSVYKDGATVRITAQLIDGVSDEHLWSESYTEDLENVLQLQANVALAITNEIRATITPEERRRLSSARSLDPEAHTALLKGRYLYNRFTRRDLELSARHFSEAIELDPSYAEPYAWLSITHWLPVVLTWDRPDFAVAGPLANEALRLDPESAAARLSIGWIAWVRDRDWKKAERSFLRAIELDPSLPDAHLALSDLLGIVFGRSDEAIQAATAALERDPLAPINTWQLGFLQMMARDFNAALEHFESVFEFAPDFAVGLPADAAYVYSHVGRHERALRLARKAAAGSGTPSSHALLALVLARAGRLEEARDSLARALEEGEEGYLAPSFAAAAHASVGNEDEAFRWLEKGVEEKGYHVLQIKRHPMYDPLRSDPRFDDLLRRIGYPES